MPLSDAAIRKAKAGSRPTKLSDGGGLFLLLNPNGSRWWRFKYRFGGKLTLGCSVSWPSCAALSRVPQSRTARWS
ncbi:Arm DNA-binding domain-containing protein [Paraburkholderia phytofirmans]|uniref:Arm DNA-binding domain-containing protein n=1 Tax=Paraburkholderia TaxID=1822464 RepID=UPI0009EE5D5F